MLICKLELGLNLSMEEYRMIIFLLSFDFFPSTSSKKRLLVSRILSNVLRYQDTQVAYTEEDLRRHDFNYK